MRNSNKEYIAQYGFTGPLVEDKLPLREDQLILHSIMMMDENRP